MNMIYIARDSNGDLNAFKRKPVRNGGFWYLEDIDSFYWRPLSDHSKEFIDLKWNDDPIEVDDLYFGIELW